jgi:spermidine synthase
MGRWQVAPPVRRWLYATAGTQGEHYRDWAREKMVDAATYAMEFFDMPWTVCHSPLELVERTHDDFWRQTYAMDREIFQLETPYQKLQIFESHRLGRVLALDGVLQLSQRFEANYHEMMAHVPVNILLGPDGVVHDGRDMTDPSLRVLILGGGDGGVATRLLQHPEVASITMCEIDRVVVDAARTWFSGALNAGFDDPRIEILITLNPKP